ncbi:addiction module killer protein [Gluconacetobacter diazotrophicus PA1 5]|uniref:type II toxin-antitoxin system RelE/ParE family toxin n=1 Tax=Gluconacetobacter diazotrophicus TaxID=33996 RepID=UPI000181EFB3|nr:type II toxin-antitoxin system RelE/ParE family toxin [Gluconacetobacter diazotrophicus]ACI50362.1 addiction module killer protein [Gluconacetobacter diazotrophicus PA1 5]
MKYEIIWSGQVQKWFRKIRDQRASAAIFERIRRIEELGLFGDVKPVGEGVHEIRVDHGIGYRVYFTTQGGKLVILLVGGDKRTQAGDIQKAKRMKKDWT